MDLKLIIMISHHHICRTFGNSFEQKWLIQELLGFQNSKLTDMKFDKDNLFIMLVLSLTTHHVPKLKTNKIAQVSASHKIAKMLTQRCT